jgi:hypothetical protein
LLPPTNDEEWTLAVGCKEFIYETIESVNCIKILQILKGNFQLSTNNPIQNHEIILSSISEESKDDDSGASSDRYRYITQIKWLRSGVFAIIYLH